MVPGSHGYPPAGWGGDGAGWRDCTGRGNGGRVSHGYPPAGNRAPVAAVKLTAALGHP